MSNNIGEIETILDNNDGLKSQVERKSRSRERGKYSKPRNFPLHTLKNLPQFRDKPHEEVRKYILETKEVDIGSNVDWNKTLM